MRGGKWGVFTGVLVMCIGCKKATEPYEIQILHVGGTPYANQPLIPFSSDSVSSGWWTHDEASTLGDTVWSDDDGRAIIHWTQPHWDGIICPLRVSNESPRDYTIRFTPGSSDSNVQTCSVPGVAFIRFIGNRHGNGAQSGFWLFHEWETPSIQPERWLTPGQPPTPSLLLHHWIHPEESLPVVRRHFTLLPNGDVRTLPALLISEDMIGDTTHHSVLH
ncbi:MAG: hypothetical protein CL828_02390 [Crocinitomicaceae bacterium]|nr:hypothetical protein [Crocinitomicaceae bacterium]